jgi:SAM-dependent methyltransferase
MSLAQTRATFETLGSTDPLWAVMTLKRYKHNRWDADKFFEIGRKEIEGVLDYVEKLGLKPGRGRALDFGCAVGRLTQPLGDHFEEVVGVDIAVSFLERAQQYNRHGARCRYLHNTRDDLRLLQDASFDFVYSNMTLQHIPAQHSSKYIAEFFRVLRGGGVAVFQLPAGRAPFDGTLAWIARRFRGRCVAPVRRWWKRKRGLPVIEMHPIAREKVEALIGASGGRVVDVVPDTWAGKGWTNWRYCAVKDDGPGA